MKTFFSFVKTTLLGGVVFLLPLIVVLILLQETLKRLTKLVKPLGEWIAVKSVLGVQTPYLFAIFLFLLGSFLAGLLARTRFAGTSRDKLDQWLAGHIPGYVATKKKTKGIVGPSPKPKRTCALVRIGDSWHFAFLMDRPQPGWWTAFVPNAPGTTSGTVHLVSEDRVKSLDLPPESISGCLENLGTGSGELLKNLVSFSTEKEVQRESK